MSDNNRTSPELPAKGVTEALHQDERRMLASYGEFIFVSAGESLIREGDPQGSLYFVIAGNLEVTTMRCGRAVHLSRIGLGETIGEINVFDAGTASATVTATDSAHVWRIDRASLEEFMNERPLPAAHLVIGIATTLCRRMRETNEKVALMARL